MKCCSSTLLLVVILQGSIANPEPLDVLNLHFHLDNENHDEEMRSMPRTLKTCPCAEYSETNRIVGGEELAVKHSLPYQAFIKIGRLVCGGSIINKRYIMSAMHCLFGKGGQLFKPSAMRVYVGLHDACNVKDEGQELLVERFIMREDYARKPTRNDISILKLKTDIIFDENVKPVCFPQDLSKTYENHKAIVAGWGGILAHRPMEKIEQVPSCVLKSTTLKILMNEDPRCARFYTGSTLCAWEKGTDSCQGDSGGPLVVKENGKYVVVGVVSYGFGCASDIPGVYTRVSKYMDWIEEHTANGNC